VLRGIKAVVEPLWLPHSGCSLRFLWQRPQ
jgi:hypothetical protein